MESAEPETVDAPTFYHDNMAEKIVFDVPRIGLVASGPEARAGSA